MTQPEQEAREMLAVKALSSDVEDARVLRLHFKEPVTGQDRSDILRAINAFARPTAGIDREERAIVCDFLASLTGGGENAVNTLSINHDELAALVKRSRAILALFPTSAKTAPVATAAKTGERGAVIEECARIAADRATLLSLRVDDLVRIRAAKRWILAIREAANHALNIERDIRALSQPLPDAPIVGEKEPKL